MRTGTCHFTSFHAACRYYAAQGFDATDVQRKLDEGEIFIGAPDCALGSLLDIDRDGRYWIEDRKP